MKSNISYCLLCVFLLLSCSEKEEVMEIAFDKELIPEGIAINPETGKIYLSSLHKHKIVEYDPDTGSSKNFIESKTHGFKQGLGLEIKDNMLFSLSSEVIHGKGSSVLLVFDLDNSKLLHSFSLKDTTSHFMNDLAISGNNRIFITDTENHMVYHLNFPNGEIETYLKDDQIQYPNGIALSGDDSKLFVDSYSSGIRIVDISSKKIFNPSYEGSNKKLVVDGLKYSNGYLYGVKNGSRDKSEHALIRASLSPDEEDITELTPLLIAHSTMNIPTTLCIEDGFIYLLANSQLENLDQETNQILKPEILSNTYIIKYKLP